MSTALPGHEAQQLAEMQRQIAEVWADVLGTGRVGPAVDFFELGGNFLHAVHIVSRNEEIAGVSLSSHSVLESRNVHEWRRTSGWCGTWLMTTRAE